MKQTKCSAFLLNAAATVIIVAGMKVASSIVVQLLLAIFIAIIMAPLFIGMQRRGVPTAIALLLLILGLIAIGVVGVGVLSKSVAGLAKDLPKYQEQLHAQTVAMVDWMERRGMDPPGEMRQSLLNTSNVMRFAGSTVSALSGVLGQAFVILLMAIFLLLEAAILPRKLQAVPGMGEQTLQRLAKVVENTRQYMGMKTLMSLLTGVLVGLVCTLLGIDYPVLLGLLAFLLNYIPNIGSLMAAIPGILLALIEFGIGRALVVAVLYLAINTLVGNILEPRVMGKGLGLSPAIVVISLVLWGWALGPIGMLLSVPLTMTMKIAMESIDETKGIAVLMGGGKQR